MRKMNWPMILLVMICNTLCVLLSVLKTREAVAADVVATDFIFQLDHRVFDAPEFRFSEILKGERELSIPDFVMASDAPVQVKGISAKLRYRFRTGSERPFLGAEFFVASDELSAVLKIREISVDAIIPRRVGGILVRARLKASCSDIEIQLPKGMAQVSATLKAGIDSAGLPQMAVPWIDLRWAENAWTVSDFKCQGAEGFQELVAEGLRKHLKSPAGFATALKKAVDEKVKAYQNDFRNWFLQPRIIPVDVDGLKVEMRPYAIVNQDNDRFQIYGKLEFSSKQSGRSGRVEVIAQDAPQSLPGFVLWVPEAVLPALNELAFRNRIYDHRKSAKQIPAFESFRNSSIQRSFVWPELGRFSKNSEFLFDFVIPRMPEISSVHTDVDGGLGFSARTDLRVTTMAPKGVGHEPFAHFVSPVTAKLKLNFIDNGQGSEIKINFSKLNTQATAHWDSGYEPRLQNNLIRVSTLEDAAVDALKTDGLSFRTGTLPINSQLFLKPWRFRKEKSWILIDWK